MSKLIRKSVQDKDGLVSAVAAATGETKSAVTRVLDSAGDEILTALLKGRPKGFDEVSSAAVLGIGTVHVKKSPAVKGKINHLTKKPMDIPERYTATFKFSNKAKLKLNEGIVTKSKDAAKKK